MAGFQAVNLVCEAVLDVLRDTVPSEFAGHSLDFQVYTSGDFSGATIGAGVSLFLYRLVPNETLRTPKGRRNASGERTRSQLPVDLHFILSFWGQDASLQHGLAGWTMRQLETTSILPSALLNRREQVFRGDESVEVILGELDNENLFRLWETVANNVYHLSVPYIARMVMIESEEAERGVPIQERQFDLQKPSALS